MKCFRNDVRNKCEIRCLCCHWWAQEVALWEDNPRHQDMALPKVGMLSSASSPICLVAGNDLLVEMGEVCVRDSVWSLPQGRKMFCISTGWYVPNGFRAWSHFLLNPIQIFMTCWVIEPCWISSSDKPKCLRVCYHFCLKLLLLMQRGFILFLGPVIFSLLKIREKSQ